MIVGRDDSKMSPQSPEDEMASKVEPHIRNIYSPGPSVLAYQSVSMNQPAIAFAEQARLEAESRKSDPLIRVE